MGPRWPWSHGPIIPWIWHLRWRPNGAGSRRLRWPSQPLHGIQSLVGTHRPRSLVSIGPRHAGKLIRCVILKRTTQGQTPRRTFKGRELKNIINLYHIIIIIYSFIISYHTKAATVIVQVGGSPPSGPASCHSHWVVPGWRLLHPCEVVGRRGCPDRGPHWWSNTSQGGDRCWHQQGDVIDVSLSPCKQRLRGGMFEDCKGGGSLWHALMWQHDSILQFHVPFVGSSCDGILYLCHRKAKPKTKSLSNREHHPRMAFNWTLHTLSLIFRTQYFFPPPKKNPKRC